MSTNSSHEDLESGTVYGQPPTAAPYHGEQADMSSNYTPEELDTNNVYGDSSEDKTEEAPESFGSIYSFTDTSVTKTISDIPLNVYDRIVESINNPMPIEKIFVAPPKHEELQHEVMPIVETKESTMEQMNVYGEEAKEKIRTEIKSVGNVY